ncbi:MAG: MFS transporter [Candidatus Methanomethylophilaceae archaeon]|nr:MFS transporter [Candidatus Methanomethylophilaceae archaeon]
MNDRTKAVLPIFGILFMVDFLNCLDASIVNVALPVILKHFNILSGSDGSWLIFGYALGLSSLILPFCKFGNNGRLRKIGVWGSILLLITSVLCGLSADFVMLIVARIAQGAASAMIAATVPIVLLDYVPKESKGVGLAVTGASTGLALVVGPTIGGIIAHLFDWTWIFYLNVPLCIILLYLYMAYLPKDSGKEKNRDPSIIGTIASLLFFASLLTLVEDLGDPDLTFRGRLIALAIAIVSAVLLIRSAKKDTDKAILATRMVMNREYMMVTIAFLLTTMVAGGLNFMAPYLMQITWGMSPSECGLYLIICSVAMMSVVIFVGKWCDKSGAKNPSLTAMIVRLITCGLGVILAPAVGIPVLVVYLVILGIGHAFSGTAQPTRMVHHATPGFKVEGTGFMLVINYFAIAAGSALFAMILGLVTGGVETPDSVFEAFKVMSLASAAIVIAATVLTLMVRNIVVDKDGAVVEN